MEWQEYLEYELDSLIKPADLSEEEKGARTDYWISVVYKTMHKKPSSDDLRLHRVYQEMFQWPYYTHYWQKEFITEFNFLSIIVNVTFTTLRGIRDTDGVIMTPDDKQKITRDKQNAALRTLERTHKDKDTTRVFLMKLVVMRAKMYVKYERITTANDMYSLIRKNRILISKIYAKGLILMPSETTSLLPSYDYSVEHGAIKTNPEYTN
mgnify:CR=1 FL=1